MGCIHRKIDNIYHDAYCELTNCECTCEYGCSKKTDLEPSFNTSRMRWEIIENGIIKEVEHA